DRERSMPDEQRVRRMANRVADAGQMAVLNIEHWPVDIRSNSPAVVAETIGKFQQIIEWAKDERPDLVIGSYGEVPIRDYWAPTDYFSALEGVAELDALGIGRYEWHKGHQGGWWRNRLIQTQPKYEAWQQANEFLRPLAESVDVLFPSLYTFY